MYERKKLLIRNLNRLYYYLIKNFYAICNKKCIFLKGELAISSNPSLCHIIVYAFHSVS